jgi:transcriptional regulator with XRE-family HTH domain
MEGSMASCKDWLTQKFRTWEADRGRRQSYYAFAHYLGVSQADLTQWMEGTAVPGGANLHTLAAHLGQDIYDTLALPRPDPQLERLSAALPNLPAHLRQRLVAAAWEASEYLLAHNLTPESIEAKKAVFEIFSRAGIRLTS